MFEAERQTLSDLVGHADADETRRRAHASIRSIAAQSRAAFSAHVTALDACTSSDALHLMDLVEALSAEARNWRNELRQIFESALRASQNGPEAEWPAHVVAAFAHLEASTPDVRDLFLSDYLRLATDPSDRLRRAAVELFAGFEVRTTPGLAGVLRTLLDDSDWRVRRDAEALLAEEHLLPEGYRPRLLDVLRRRSGIARRS